MGLNQLVKACQPAKLIKPVFTGILKALDSNLNGM